MPRARHLAEDKLRVLPDHGIAGVVDAGAEGEADAPTRPTAMARASGPKRAKRSSFGTTSALPALAAASACSGRAQLVPLNPWSMHMRAGATPSVSSAGRCAAKSAWRWSSGPGQCESLSCTKAYG